ncbi:mitochondrial basic amino acids transporter-like [Pollicipes pollicipes]|uniref:mitochondrial basic amino acids transporter-like n=1 Tax=Pollicipes pollicipes TaxID=41117 RepID=UPI00188582AE|nr:mitochondrial basic amino acids transporter-like [Pollicipes pollicipes]
MATDFAAGCVGGVAGVVVGHPLDTVKVRIQTQCARNPTYRGTFHCLHSILVKEGTRGLYRGLTSPMFGVAAVNALTFGIQGNVRRLMADPDCLSAQCRAGMIAGGCQAIVVSPMELVKSQLQVQSDTTGMGRRFFRSPWDCCRQLYASTGWRGLMRGYWITVAREVPAFGLYFGTYELLTTGLVGDQRKSLSHMLLAGGMAGVASWVFTYPIDVVKTRIQTDGMAGIQLYSGYINCVHHTFQREGWRGFVRGVNSASIRAFPTNAVTLAVVSVILELNQERRRAAATAQESLQLPEEPPRRQLLGQQLPLGPLGSLGAPQITVTQMTVQIETSDGGDAARRRKATIRLDGQMALGQLRCLLDREVEALQGQLLGPGGQSALPISAQRAPVAPEPTECEAQPKGGATGGTAAVTAPPAAAAGDGDEEEEEQLEMQTDVLPCRHVRRETTVVTHIVEYDVGDDQMSRLLETAAV